ncbi:cold shock domain-containing protein [Paramesorhizobium deserti]|uniref:cold-shock protein n=1 Tax=Paramesorhizobium deserti TaxID=1494590 RepID=UPI0009E972A3
MPTGRVIAYNDTKGYGLIQSDPIAVFFHRSALESATPKAGDTVRYETTQEGRNSPRATTVRVLDPAVMAEADRVFGTA